MKRAFTLIELLVVIAIIAILSAILFPVFASAKQAAKKTVAISNFQQLGAATALYAGDYDGGYMLSNSGSLFGPGWGYGPPDTVPGQVMAPYIKNTKINIDPMDPWQDENKRIADHMQWMHSSTVSTTATQRAYALAVRSNFGYNYAFFSPWRQTSDGYVGSAGTSESDVTKPAETLMWGTSIWDREPNGGPKGGGNWVIETPCWQDPGGYLLRPMKQYGDDGTLRSYPQGWSTTANDWKIYGGLWPLYDQTDLSKIAPGLKDGRVVLAFADSHVKVKPLAYTTQGCSAYGQGDRKGIVTDKDKYIWDLD